MVIFIAKISKQLLCICSPSVSRLKLCCSLLRFGFRTHISKVMIVFRTEAPFQHAFSSLFKTIATPQLVL